MSRRGKRRGAVTPPVAVDNSSGGDYMDAYLDGLKSGGFYFLNPQILNDAQKGINAFDGLSITYDDVAQMVMSPHRFEGQLRKLSYAFYHTVSIYRQLIDFRSALLDYSWEPILIRKDGLPITPEEFASDAFKRDYARVERFFARFDVKREFRKVLFNCLLYDTCYMSLREYGDHLYLQELPASYCMIDANSYLGYLFSFDLSYFTLPGSDITGYSPAVQAQYAEVVKVMGTAGAPYQPHLPDRSGSWVYWHPMTPDDGWVFKFNTAYAGSIPPTLDAFLDYTKIDKYKDLEDKKKALESYKLIMGTVPRLQNSRAGARADSFAISGTQLKELNQALASGLKVDFRAVPFEDLEAFEFNPGSSEDNLLQTELATIAKNSGLADAVQVGGSSVSALNLYKSVTAAQVAQAMYPQFSAFVEYHLNKVLKKYRVQVRFSGTLFDREDRMKQAQTQMERGLITPSVLSVFGYTPTQAANGIGLMHAAGFPAMLTPVQTASTMSGGEAENGRAALSDDDLSDAGEQTRDSGGNIEKGGSL